MRRRAASRIPAVQEPNATDISPWIESRVLNGGNSWASTTGVCAGFGCGSSHLPHSYSIGFIGQVRFVLRRTDICIRYVQLPERVTAFRLVARGILPGARTRFIEHTP